MSWRQLIRACARRNGGCEIRAFYQRLVAAGKPKKVAIIACMRKLLDAVYYVARTRTAFVQKAA